MKTTASPGKTGGNFYGLGTYLGLAGALLAMIVLFSVLSDHFLSYDTFSTLANQIPDLMVLAVGMTFILIIGGTSLMGGHGSVISTFFGVLIILVLAAGLAQIGATEPTKRIITGAVIVIAVVLDTYRSQRASRRG